MSRPGARAGFPAQASAAAGADPIWNDEGLTAQYRYPACLTRN